MRQIHDHIVAALTETYAPVVETIEMYWPFDDLAAGQTWTINTPALLLEIESFDPGDPAVDPGDGRESVSLSFVLHCILSTRTPAVEIAIRDFALQVYLTVDENLWGFENAAAPAGDEAVDTTKLVALMPSDQVALPSQIILNKPGFVGWSVAWSQTFHVGESVLDSEVFVPDTLCLSYEPETGPANEASYHPLLHV